MTRKEFEKLKIKDWFHSKARGENYKIQDTDLIGSRFWVEIYDVDLRMTGKTFWSWINCENYDFEIGKNPESSKVEQPEQQSAVQEMTLQDALKAGLKIGDSVYVKLTFKGIDLDNENVYNLIFADSIGLTKLYSSQQAIQPMTFELNNELPYIPKHNETCAILTKNGFATKAVAIHYKDKISAVSIDKEGNTDYHFKAEQIEKFFPLPPA